MIRTSLLAPCLALGATLSLDAQTWVEAGEAGNLPATAQTPVGVGALTQIDGNLNDPAEPTGAGNDRDMYLIQIDNPATFTATTVGGTVLDTQLFLFQQSGLGVSFNDDSGITTQSALSGAFVPAPGLYLIAVSRFDRDPTGLGLEIWADTPFTTERAPDGPGAANPIDGWNGIGATGITGSYSIFLTSASFPNLTTSCADLAVGGTGAPGTNLTFSLTGADPNAFAWLVIGAVPGTTVINIGPLGTLTLGLVDPFIPHPIGQTDASGDASGSIFVPPGLPFSLDLLAQGFSWYVDVQHGPPGPATVSFVFCTSGVESFHIGN
ncbi:MAG TPA: hypothetical protein VF384_00830 [Planctomycetota bacterium]